MEETKFDISNPANFIWNGSIIHGFDEEGLSRLSSLRRELRSTLSRDKKKNYSKSQLINKKEHLDNVANNQLLQLDLYSAALKHDMREISVRNIGIAASIDDATSKKTTSQASFQIAIENSSKDYELEEKKKMEEFQKSIEQLQKEAISKANEIKKLESDANSLKNRAENHSIQLKRYNKYQEWIALNKNFFTLQKKRENLENSLRRMRKSKPHTFNTEKQYFFPQQNASENQRISNSSFGSFHFENANSFYPRSYNFD